MTVSSEINKSGPYTADGVAQSFDYDFRVLDATHLQVIVTTDGVDATADPSGYSVSGVGVDGGGAVVFSVAPAAGKKVSIIRNVPFTQGTDLENQGAFYAETVEQAFDLAAMRDQQLQEQLDRSLKIAVGAEPAELDILVQAVQTVAANVDDINAVADDIASVNAVAPVADDVAVVSENISDLTWIADVYYGPSATDPTTRRDGSPLQDGDFYFNTNVDLIRVRDGGAWHSSVKAAGISTYRYTATDGQTVFSGAAIGGAILSVDAGSLIVHLNGVALVEGDDFTVTGGGASVTLAAGAALGDDLTVMSFDQLDYAGVLLEMTALRDETQDYRDETQLAANNASMYDPTRRFATVAALLASTRAAGGVGTIWQGEGFLYREAAAGASDQHVTTAGGVKLYVLPSASGTVTPRQFGALGDGVDDTAAMLAWVAWLNASTTNAGELGAGVFAFSQTLNLTMASRSIIGHRSGYRTGSARLGTTLRWTGGAAPMFATATARHRFADFGVESNGSATDFLEMNSGAQAVYMDRVFFGSSLFTRSVIRSNGNRAGYSRFHQVAATLSAPKFLDIDGQGTSNGIVPISFVECQFSGSGTGGTTPWTVVYIKDETVEQIVFDRCTLISRGGLVLVDTTDTPLATTINNLIITNSEIDNVEGATFRMGRLTNVRNITFDNNMVTGNGTPTYLFDCVNSGVVSCRGNDMQSIQYIFSLDATSTISGLGRNNFDWSSCEGIHDNPAAAQITLAQAGAIIINGARMAPDEVAHVVVDITGPTGYDFRLDLGRPENMEPGQRFTITVRNVSGGVVSAGSFNASTFKANTPVAPANGFSRTYNFRFNGTHAVEQGRTAADVPN